MLTGVYGRSSRPSVMDARKECTMYPYISMLLIGSLSLLLVAVIHHEFHKMNEHPERYHHHFKH